MNENLIHILRKGIESHLHNRFSNKCRDIFFPPRKKEALGSGRARFRGPAARPDEAAPGPAQSIRAPTHHPARRQRARPPDRARPPAKAYVCLLYTSDAADERSSV